MQNLTSEQKRELFLKEFKECQPALTAIGDHTRQCIIITLIKNGGKGGLRVGDIQKETNISRTAVSHHLKILKESCIINVHREGTKNYYFIDPKSSSLKRLVRFLEQVEPIMELCENTKLK